VGDVRHLAVASGVQIILAAQLIPRFEGAELWDALGSGEEYELCVTAPEIDTEEFQRRFGIQLTLIGDVIASDKPDVIVGMSAMFKTPESFNHFGNDHK
jgi:thiamine monophosphate kinase